MNRLTKVICEDCKWTGLFGDMLKGINPFDPDDTIYACPDCQTLASTCIAACDEPDCWEPATCGFPIKDGYRQTCGEHFQKDGIIGEWHMFKVEDTG